jgi:transcriptional regulator with XRE-family HTH domain
MMLIRQVKAARALLDWSQDDLADKSGLPARAIARFERGGGESDDLSGARDRIVNALRAAGVIFVEENGGGPGVRLKGRRIDPCSIPVEMLNASNDQ